MSLHIEGKNTGLRTTRGGEKRNLDEKGEGIISQNFSAMKREERCESLPNQSSVYVAEENGSTGGSFWEDDGEGSREREGTATDGRREEGASHLSQWWYSCEGGGVTLVAR